MMKLRSVKGALLAVGVVLTASLGFSLTTAPGAHAESCSSPVSSGGSSGWAGLIIKVEVNGSAKNGVSGTLTNTDSGSQSIVNLSGYDYGSNKKSQSFTSGSDNSGHGSCSGGGKVVFGYYNSWAAVGEGYALDCKQETGNPGYTEKTSHFQIDMGGSPDGVAGSWSGEGSFTVTNGDTKTVTVNWTDNPPPPTADVAIYKEDTSYNTLSAVNGAQVWLEGYGTKNGHNPETYNNIDTGSQTFHAYDYGAYDVQFVQMYDVTAGDSYTTRSNPFTFTAKANHVYHIRIIFALDDRSSCASPHTANTTTVATGATFHYNFAFNNVGSHSWPTTGYGAQAYFQNHATSGGVPAGTVNVDGTNTLRLAQVITGGSETAYFDTYNTPDNEATFTAPNTAGTYYINTTMYNGDGHFGAVCSKAITVVNPYNYIPHISSNIGGSLNLPASSSFVSPGQTFTPKLTIKNALTTANTAGDAYNWGIYAYTGVYDASTSSISFSASNPAVATGSDNGIAPGGTDVQTASYTVPANAPDGTQICFVGRINTAQDSLAGTDHTYRYTDFHTASSYLDDTNYHDAYAPGNIVLKDMCFEVQSVRSADLQVNQGDVHAGGNIAGSDGTCAAPAAGKGNITGTGTTYSYAEYVTSAYGNIIGFGSGGGGNALTLSNLSSSGGQYGYICRPDLAAVAATYPRAGTIAGNSLTAAQFNALGSGLYYHNGPLTIAGGTIGLNHRVTIYNVGNVTINGNITYTTAPASLSSIPSFGVITGSGGNILISKNVTTLHGFYVASNSTTTNGYIDTCYEHDPSGPSSPSHATGDCPNTLNILGSLTGHNIYFWRTGASGSNQNGHIPTEIVTQSGILFLAPPPAFETQSNSPYALPSFLGEYSPLY